MKHVFWLRPGQIAGRSGPNLDPWDPSELASAGIGAILSVNDGELVHVEDLKNVRLDYRCIPLSDAAPPRPGDKEICLEALPRALDYATAVLGTGKRLLVHCRSGKDRTGMFMAYFLSEIEGLSTQEAIQEVKRVRPIAFSAEGWDEFAIEVLEELRASRRLCARRAV